MTIDEAKAVMVKMGYTPGKVDDNRGWIHVWSAEIDPKTKYFMACVTYEKETGHLTENCVDGPERYYKYDDGCLKKEEGFFASLKKELLRGWKG